MAEALRKEESQLALYGGSQARARVRPSNRSTERHAPLCSGCRTREARYGFRDQGDDPTALRPRTLCFDCFRMEITWRQDVAARMARGWNGEQAQLPLEARLNALTRRRRRAQIAARHALGEL
ncbi:MAG TPA: hypothetical protein VMS40_26505 [Vicinamibacterales bacterium]|nr:hypothetical protein [Vicinamibacterales bacterium]